MKIFKQLRRFGFVLMGCMLLSQNMAGTCWAEEYEETSDDEEGEYIPEAYYEPIQTNDIPGWPQGQMIQAGAGIVMDLDTNTVLYGKNVDRAYYPASTTKVVTALVALEQGLDLDEPFIVGEEVYDIEADSTHLGIQPGEELTLRQALYGLMLESANDLGNAIAVRVAGSVSAFAELMNQKAAQVGCTNTHFTNPHGLHSDEHYTTAHDLALLAQAAYENPQFREIISTTEGSIPETNLTEEVRYFLNHHRMIQTSSDRYRDWCTGGKTGFTRAAWNTLVTFGEKDGMRLVCVLLCENGADRSYEETTMIMEDCFNQFKEVSFDQQEKSPTFQDILKLNYPNEGHTVEISSKLKEKVLSQTAGGYAVVPVDADPSLLRQKAYSNQDGTIAFSYYYSDVPVGYGHVALSPFPTDLTFSYEQTRDMTALIESSMSYRADRELEQTFEKAVAQLEDGFSGLMEYAEKYIQENEMTVLLGGALLLLILVIMLIIVIMRATRESRIQKKRRQEQLERARAEEEIDNASAIEIEEELRRAMEMERKNRLREERRRAELEQAEQQLRETEQLIDSMNRLEASAADKQKPDAE